MSLLSKMKEATQKDVAKYGRKELSTTFSTGIPSLDYFNGKITVDPVTGKQLLMLGVNAGKPIMWVGPTSSGKSTVAYQIAYNIVSTYAEDPLIWILDYENAFEPQRFMSLPGVTPEWYKDHVEVRSTGLHSESILHTVVELYNLKKSLGDEIMMDDPYGQIDPLTGKVYRVYQPSVIIVDSLAFVLPEKMAQTSVKDADLNGQTAAGRISQVNGDIFKQITPLMRETNIFLITVNHLTTAFSPNGMPKAPVVKGLQTDEHIPGGKSITYISDTLFVIKLKDAFITPDTTKNKWYRAGFIGYEAEIKMLKSRNSPANRTFSLMFDQTNGIDPLLSMINDLEEAGIITSAAGYKKLPDDTKFKLADVREMYTTNEEFRNKLFGIYHEFGVNRIKVAENMQSNLSEDDVMQMLSDEAVSADDEITDVE